MRLRVPTAEQAAQIAPRLQRIQELETRLAKDSRSCSKPPSSAPPIKQPPPRTLPQPKGRKPDGQKDHQGAARDLVEDPEGTMTAPLIGTRGFGRGLPAIALEMLPERRQVADLLVRREVTEYRIANGVCPCGRSIAVPFARASQRRCSTGPGWRS